MNEVILIEADALVAMVDAKLRSPLQVTLGPDGLQRLFSSSGILSAADVIEQLVYWETNRCGTKIGRS